MECYEIKGEWIFLSIRLTMYWNSDRECALFDCFFFFFFLERNRRKIAGRVSMRIE